MNDRVDYVKADPNEPARRVYGVVRDAQGEVTEDNSKGERGLHLLLSL